MRILKSLRARLAAEEKKHFDAVRALPADEKARRRNGWLIMFVIAQIVAIALIFFW